MAGRPQDPLRHAGHVVRRVLLRRNIAIDAETAQLVADAVQAALQSGAPSRPPRRRLRVPPWRLRTAVLIPYGGSVAYLTGPATQSRPGHDNPSAQDRASSLPSSANRWCSAGNYRGPLQGP